ncbi:hypothetical protein [Nocardioides lianchengensis]|uniref:hypothetical protein n=1 Tax=Nocardioides lianchengensis TaxID=1045774 RepID=UPI000B8568DE|nr:hypothetical protein [Nocardioides lianchengensis]NYG08956.1 putative membrane protein [Nocardioides lianchengensis]
MTDDRPAAPRPLLAAALLAALESLALLVSAVLELVNVSGVRITMGLTTALFFLVYGAALGLCAWGLTRLALWSRAPVVLAQLIQLGVAWSFRGGETTAVSVVLAVVAVAVLVGIFHPASTAALVDDPTGLTRQPEQPD